MPVSKEKEILSNLLDYLDDESKENKNMKIQKKFLLLTSFVLIVVTIIGFKYACIPTLWLLFIAGISGMSLMGLTIIHHTQYQISILKPYINISAIKDRINEIKI